MKTLNLKPCLEIELIKEAIILDGEIANNYDEAYPFQFQKTQELNTI